MFYINQNKQTEMAKIITLTQDNKSYKIVTTFLDGTIEITILQQGLAYTAKVSEEHINHWATSMGFSDEEYFISLKKYFTNTNSDVSINITESEFNIYKSKYDKYFSVPLIETDYKSTIDKLIDSISMKNIELKTLYEGLINKQNDSSAATAQKAKALMDFAQKSRDYKENTNSTFLKLLNSKKQRIQFLMDIINGDNIKINTKRAKMLRTSEKIASADNVCINDDNDDSEKIAEETQDQDMNNDDDVFALLDENECEMQSVPFRKPQAVASSSIIVTETTDRVVEPNDENIMDTASESTQDLICSTQDLLQRIN
ncbi:PREDICTED: uncharacterized protein LOC108560528 isoform X1 [Nicrophorus vespilloides]|uniref:Uncharacterized protein LOC108560528 isoform X1 n=1 Tax=Nicrophorus vespilloides TaxID=110193 RepID=A0ABM1MG98_NICVS|nr:PREDICTED: uncharacterized protein LOC108560528 isoform X1 [Nicrophorus vespilloides]